MSLFLRNIGALYSVDYERRTKTCAHCGCDFCDVTKRNLRKTCSDACDVASMVAKRMLRGSYVQTEEQKEKKSQSCKATYMSSDVFGPELRAKFSEIMKRTWEEGRIDTTKHWTKTASGRKRLSQMMRGRKASETTRAKMSKAAQGRLRSKREMMYSSSRGGFRSDLGVYFRSTWEANFARILNYQGKKWSYEHQSFQLGSSLSYTPDFFIEDDNVFYEIKGRWTEKCRRQLELMRQLFPDVVVYVVDCEKYGRLKVEYRDKIAWEGK